MLRVRCPRRRRAAARPFSARNIRPKFVAGMAVEAASIGAREGRRRPGIQRTARGTIRSVSVFHRRSVFNLGTRHEVTACVGMPRNHAALGGAVLCTTRCRQRAGGRRGGRRDRWDCRRWARRCNGGDRRRLGRRRDRRVQPAPNLRLPLSPLCRAWRLSLDTGALQPLGRMAAGLLRTILV
jgi:hypothetical protein